VKAFDQGVTYPAQNSCDTNTKASNSHRPTKQSHRGTKRERDSHDGNVHLAGGFRKMSLGGGHGHRRGSSAGSAVLLCLQSRNPGHLPGEKFNQQSHARQSVGTRRRSPILRASSELSGRVPSRMATSTPARMRSTRSSLNPRSIRCREPLRTTPILTWLAGSTPRRRRSPRGRASCISTMSRPMRTPVPARAG
jgi:hypothetical protein